MLEHYGFERINKNKATSHLIFRHRDYDSKIENVKVTAGSGDADAGFVKSVAKACLRVKVLNKIHRSGSEAVEPLPEWLPQAFGHGFTCEMTDGEMTITHRNNGSPERSYSVHSKDGTLNLISNDYPDLETIEFNPKPGDRKPIQGFNRLFRELDDVVRSLLQERDTALASTMEALMNTVPPTAPAPTPPAPAAVAPPPAPVVSNIERMPPARGQGWAK